MKKLFKLSMGMTAVLTLAVILMTVFTPAAAFGLSLVSTLIPGTSGAAYEGLSKEIWLNELLKGFYADDMWLSECRDLSAFVDNDKINLAEAGIDPEVLINNTTYPIDIEDRDDIDLAITIDRYDTVNTRILYADKVEQAYDKLSSVVEGHKNSLRMTIMHKAAHAIAPSADSTFTPLLTTTGADRGDGSGLKRMTYADILRLKRRFDNARIPAAGRILVLSSTHQEDLELEDSTRYNQVMTVGTLAGFKLYFQAEQDLPVYNKTTGAKAAFGALAAPSTDTVASFAFSKNEVARAMGSSQMFYSKAEDSPTTREDVIGFAQRAIVTSMRNKGIAAIYSPAAA